MVRVNYKIKDHRTGGYTVKTGLLLKFSIDSEESRSGPLYYPVGIVIDRETGELSIIPVERLTILYPGSLEEREEKCIGL